MEKDKNYKLRTILEKMSSSYEEYFDKETAEYILSNISKEVLNEKSVISEYALRSYGIETNFWGRVLINNIYRINDHLKENSELPPSIKMWKELLSQKDPSLVESPKITIRLTSKENQYPAWQSNERVQFEVEFNTVLALKDMVQWNKYKDKEFLGMKIGEVNKELLAIGLLHPETNYSIPSYNENNPKSENKQLVLDLLAILIEARPKLIEKSIHDDNSFGKMVLSSHNTRSMLAHTEIEEISPLFSMDGLRGLIKEANLMDNVKQKSSMLSNILALAPAQKWMDAWAGKKEFNLLELFANKYQMAYRQNIRENNDSSKNKHKAVSRTAINALKEELEYFLPVILTKNVSLAQKYEFFNALLRTEDSSLVKIYLNIAPIPEHAVGKNNEGSNEYSRMMDNFTHLNRISDDEVEPKIFDSWANWHTAWRAHQLNNELPKKAPQTKKLKI